ncbi:AbrB/MazE/SpoVT family DNA-binding domain-containing protein [Vulcanisaeta souniana]|uniref:AbrB/MazE/SpoVT family DNA-binding domain-containing protein n=1 Tax=Vulcanisaeta souniana TaxID=164452 RepID=UPI001FB466B0|nr:AbrB/MazE/SpoVT family DNA-binding domain-containing protein [Vulcanisaeta souniana]
MALGFCDRSSSSSRQFTIPRETREEYGIEPLSEIEIISVKPSITWNRKTYKQSPSEGFE